MSSGPRLEALRWAIPGSHSLAVGLWLHEAVLLTLGALGLVMAAIALWAASSCLGREHG